MTSESQDNISKDVNNSEKSEINNLFKQLSDKANANLFDQVEKIYQDIINIKKVDLTEKASILYKSALVISENKNTDNHFIEKYWQKAIESYENLNDDFSKALVIHNMATTLAGKGEIELAKKYWYESILIKEGINDTLGIAASLCNLGWLARFEGEFNQERALYLKATELLSENQAWTELVNVLIKLSVADPDRSNYYLAQALYLAIYVYIDPKTVFSIVSNIIKNITFENEFSPIISSAGIILTWSEDNSEEAQELQNVVKEMMVASAMANNIKAEDISDWIIEKNLNNSEFIFKELDRVLTIVSGSDKWFFSKEKLNNL